MPFTVPTEWQSNTDWHAGTVPPLTGPARRPGSPSHPATYISEASMGFEKRMPECTGCQNEFVAWPQAKDSCECPEAPADLDRLFCELNTGDRRGLLPCST